MDNLIPGDQQKMVLVMKNRLFKLFLINTVQRLNAQRFYMIHGENTYTARIRK